MEPYIKPSNAHTKVSVSPNEYYWYNNILIKTRYDSIPTTEHSIILVTNVFKGSSILVPTDKLRPPTVAEKILFVNG